MNRWHLIIVSQKMTKIWTPLLPRSHLFDFGSTPSANVQNYINSPPPPPPNNDVFFEGLGKPFYNTFQ